MFLHLDISANDVFVKGIRFVNNAGPDGGQAVALRVAGDRIAIYQCSIKGYQDTLLTAYGIHFFFRECEVYGTVDSIFGNSRVVLQNCDIYVRKRTEGTVNMIIAQSRGQVEDTGIVLHNCSIKADKDLQPYPLKRIKYEIRLGKPNRPMSMGPKKVEPILCVGPLTERRPKLAHHISDS